MSAGTRNLAELAAAPIPTGPANPLSPVVSTPQARPPLPPIGNPSRTTTIPRYYGDAKPTAAASDLGFHSQIERVDGSPVGAQTDWDGARRPTYRLTPIPWSEGLYVESDL